MPLSLDADSTFSFSAYFAPKTVGLLSSDVLANTTNGVTGFSTSTPISLRGNASSVAPLLTIAPGTVTFTTMVGSGPSSNSAIFRNNGDSVLTIQNVSYSVVAEKGPWITPNITNSGNVQIGPFTFSNLPKTIAPNQQAVVGITYSATNAGNHAVYVKAFSDGGDKILDVFGTAGSAPNAVVEFQSADRSAWIPYTAGENFSFGDVLQGTTRNLVSRITNNGSDTASPLGLTISKPPFGVPGIVGAVNNVDLAEGTLIPAGQSRNATLFCAAKESQVNVASTKGSAKWTFNTNSEGGKFELNFDCTAISQQVGPKLANGTSQYGYVGCFRDLTPGRQLAVLSYADNTNANGRCLEACGQANWKFAGTSYRDECWCGNALPLTMDTDDDCNYRCSGAQNETCGGDGIAHNKGMMSIFADTQKFDGNTTSAPLAITQQSGEYTYAGCYKETAGKSFDQKATNSKILTVDLCRTFCAGYPLFGLQFSEECFCGTTIASSASLTNDTDCNMSCRGDNSQYCGAGSRMQVYQRNGTISSTSSSSTTHSSTSTTATIASTTPNTVSANSSSSTSTVTSPPSGMTAPTSVACPDSNGTTVTSGGKSFLIECGIDHAGGDLTSLTVSSFAACIDACAQNADCLDVSMSGVGCYLKSVLGAPVQNGGVWGAKRVASTQSSSSSSSTSSSASNTGASVSSTLTSTESFASSTSNLASSSSVSTSVTSTTSTSISSAPTAIVCPASNSTTYVSNGESFLIECGVDRAGGDMETVDASNLKQCIDACAKTPGCTNVAFQGAACYMKNKIGSPVYNGVSGARLIATQSLTTSATSSALSSTANSTSIAPSTTRSDPLTTSASSTSVVLSSSTTSSQTSSSSTAASQPISTTSVPPSAPTKIGDYKYLGCYNDVPGRALKQKQTSGAEMTNESCQKFCEGYQYFGAEYANECFCGRNLHVDSRPATDGRCNMKCAGDETQICGGPSGLTLYAIPSNSSGPDANPSAPVVVPSASGYIAQGCFSEKIQGRVLPNLYYGANMTIQTCATEAKQQNSTWFGVEYGAECFHGSTLDNSSMPVNQTKCDMTCPGNATTWCGGSSALQLYRLPLECPTDNGTAWNSFNGTARFEIQCATDRAGGASAYVDAQTFEDCLNACAMESTCKSVACRNTDCYLKSTLGQIVGDSGIRGAAVVERRDLA